MRAASDYMPGETAMQIAFLREAFEGPRRKLHIYTTNYDDLLEVALEASPKLAELGYSTVLPYTGPDDDDDPDELHIKVRHLHGFLGRSGSKGSLTLTERSYFGEAAKREWQYQEVVHELTHNSCLFLGTSLTDLNIVRYLHEHGGKKRHAIVFVREAEIYDVPEHVREARERVAIDRWGSERLDVVFVDHYADVAQLILEIA